MRQAAALLAQCGLWQAATIGIKARTPATTAKPIITSVPRSPVPVEPVRAERMPTPAKPVPLTKKQMYEMLAQAVRNTG